MSAESNKLDRMWQEFGELKRSGSHLDLFQYTIAADMWRVGRLA